MQHRAIGAMSRPWMPIAWVSRKCTPAAQSTPAISRWRRVKVRWQRIEISTGRRGCLPCAGAVRRSVRDSRTSEPRSRLVIQHSLDEVNGILILEPKGRLSAQDFVELTRVVDQYLYGHGRLHGLLIEAASFPGW